MIGVCIKYFHKNYGGMLQAYATTAMLEQRGIDYELIRYKKERSVKAILRSLPRLLNRILLNDKYEALLKKVGMKLHPELEAKDAVRNGCFDAFCDIHFTKLSPVFEGYSQLCEGAQRYSAVITGSDQLWSPAGLPTNYYNLMFVPEETLKISLASSFGVNEIPWYQKKRTAAFLKRLDYISMRENRGSEIVKELTGRDVPTILDPVFFLSREEWEEKIPNRREMEEPYIFVYFLGTTREHRIAVSEFARQKGMKIVTLRHMDQYVAEDENFGDIAPYDVSPDRFLNLLRNAEYVFTDSFHGTAFSVINRKQFVVFNRYLEQSSFSKNSRIDTLCENFGLSQYRFGREKSLEQVLETPIDYTKVDQRLETQQQITREYLDKILYAIYKREQYQF